MTTINPNKNANLLIWVLSIAIPVVVALLIYMPQTGALGTLDVSFLPSLNALLNSLVAVCLLAGLYFVKNKNIAMHRTFMFTAFVLSSLFLISYVTYHFQAPATKYGGEGVMRMIYFTVLLTHIILAAVVVPLVLFTIYFAISNQIDKHKKLVKFTYPIWLYVSVTGPLVYFMISPYYSH